MTHSVSAQDADIERLSCESIGLQDWLSANLQSSLLICLQPSPKNILRNTEKQDTFKMSLPQQPTYVIVPSPEPSIESDRLLLRPITDADATALFAIRSRPEVAEMKSVQRSSPAGVDEECAPC